MSTVDAELRARRPARHGGARAPHRAAARSRARASPSRTISWPISCRHRRGLGRPCRRSRRSTCRRCSRRSTAIPTAARSRSSAAPCRCSTSTSSPRRSASALDQNADERVENAIERVLARQGFGRLVRPVVGGRRGRSGSTAYVADFLTRARERGFRRAAAGLQPRPRPPAQLRRQHDRGEQGRRRPRLCGLCAGAQRPPGDGRPALSRRHQAGGLSPRRSPAPRSPPRWRCSATAAARRRPSARPSSSCGPARDGGVVAARLRLAPARRRRHAGAGLGGGHRPRRHPSDRGRWSRRSAPTAAPPAPRRTPGWCSPPRR